MLKTGWLRSARASLRLRLLLLVLLALVPALLLSLYTHAEESALVKARAYDEARRLVQLASLDQERVIEGTRQMLIVLAALQEVLEAPPAACRAFPSELFRRY